MVDWLRVSDGLGVEDDVSVAPCVGLGVLDGLAVGSCDVVLVCVLVWLGVRDRVDVCDAVSSWLPDTVSLWLLVLVEEGV